MNAAAYPTFSSENPKLNQELHALLPIVNNDINKAPSCECGSDCACSRCDEGKTSMQVDPCHNWAVLSSLTWLI